VSLNLIDQAAQRKRIDDLLANPVASAKELESLRHQVTLLRKLIVDAKQAFDGVEVDSRWFDRGMVILDEAFAATEPKK
jgi:hypothetical protein